MVSQYGSRISKMSFILTPLQSVREFLTSNQVQVQILKWKSCTAVMEVICHNLIVFHVQYFQSCKLRLSNATFDVVHYYTYFGKFSICAQGEEEDTEEDGFTKTKINVAAERAGDRHQWKTLIHRRMAHDMAFIRARYCTGALLRLSGRVLLKKIRHSAQTHPQKDITVKNAL